MGEVYKRNTQHFIILSIICREKKVVLKGTNDVHLQELQKLATEKNMHSYLVRDAGRTQIPEGSITVLGLFGEENLVNSISGKLGLL